MEPVLITNCLTKTYGKKNVVNQVNMRIEKGDIYGFVGKNGAGKTTLMKMVCGLANPTAGDFTLFGSDRLEEGRQKIGCVIEQPALFPGMTAKQNLIYYSKMRGIAKTVNISAVLQQVGLAGAENLKTKKFSLGMKQRLSIAIALLGEPEFLVLDEPINGLDPAGIHEVRQLLLRLNQEKKITILISSHILGELGKMATKYGIIDNGTLVEEFLADEMERRISHFIRIEVDDARLACKLLQEQCHIVQLEAFSDHSICIREQLDQCAEINETLVRGGVRVSHLAVEGQDLEMFFLNQMGGLR